MTTAYVRPIRTRTVIGNRPPQAPEGWTIFNAPRPIYGGAEWRGEFCSGVFYTAHDPTAPNYDALFELNRQQDAVVLTYVSAEEVFQEGRTRILAQNPEAADFIDQPEHRAWIIDSQLDHLNQP